MAKGLPYFKFISTEWLTGNICFEGLEVQGLFINICALYWQRDGNLSISEIEQRYKKKSIIAKLSGRFFSVTDGLISIDFLDEQLTERQHVSKTNSENGKLGGRKPKVKNKPIDKQSESEPQANFTQEEGEEERELNNNQKESEKEVPTPELEFDYMIGEDEILSIHEVFKEKFLTLYNTACSQYGELKIKKWTDDFGNLHKQKTWKDYQDFRQHLSNYFSIRSQKENESTKNGFNGSKKGLGTTIPTNEGKPAGRL